MRRLFTTDDVPTSSRLQSWDAFFNEYFCRITHLPLGGEPPRVTLGATQVGATAISQLSVEPMRARLTWQDARANRNTTDKVWLNLVTAGSVRYRQGDLLAVDRVGDISIRDPLTACEVEYHEATTMLVLGLPRRRLELMLGPSRNFVGLTIGGELPTATLARRFLLNLARVGDTLGSQAAERTNAAFVDLVIAALAERMAKAAPASLSPTLIVQRAKAHVEANLADPGLSPGQVAAATGVSIRYLQGLFSREGHGVADWIWQRRLELAERRLSDPASMHLSLGAVAFSCGFADPAHFSRRFRDRFGHSPRDFRQAALTAASAPSGKSPCTLRQEASVEPSNNCHYIRVRAG